jgi:hypothetical protein
VKVSMAVRRFSRLILVVLGGLVLTVALAAPASARTSVDPSTLNPAPPDSFNAVCFLDGKPYHVRSGIPRPGRRGCALRHRLRRYGAAVLPVALGGGEADL